MTQATNTTQPCRQLPWVDLCFCLTKGYTFGGPGLWYTILGSILRSACLWKLQCSLLVDEIKVWLRSRNATTAEVAPRTTFLSTQSLVLWTRPEFFASMAL